jgi:hypothetical protein
MHPASTPAVCSTATAVSCKRPSQCFLPMLLALQWTSSKTRLATSSKAPTKYAQQLTRKHRSSAIFIRCEVPGMLSSSASLHWSKCTLVLYLFGTFALVWFSLVLQRCSDLSDCKLTFWCFVLYGFSQRPCRVRPVAIYETSVIMRNRWQYAPKPVAICAKPVAICDIFPLVSAQIRPNIRNE